jgi:hypothetical protein
MALAVLLVELHRQLPGAHEVFGSQELERRQRRFQPARGVQTRTEHEANVARCALTDLKLRHARQRMKSLALRLADLAEALADEHAVFPDERRQVGNRPECN